MMKPWKGSGALFVVGMMVVVALTGCEDILRNTAEIPSRVEATQGEYSNSVVITWSEVRPTNEEKVVTGYDIQRSPSTGSATTIGSTSRADATTYTDRPVDSGVSYTYRVRAVFQGHGAGDWSSGAIGYALQGEQLQVFTIERYEADDDAGWSEFSNREQWHTFPAVRGWEYTVHVEGSGIPTVAVYRRGNITNSVPTLDSDTESTVTFRAGYMDDYHIRVAPGEGANARVRVSY